ncbi:Serine hydroxymethyltransferase [Aphelenchoides besseyi]|nr:Serine hydroxymethyltransferase [Aphelenchoides besseyi]
MLSRGVCTNGPCATVDVFRKAVAKKINCRYSSVLIGAAAASHHWNLTIIRMASQKAPNVVHTPLIDVQRAKYEGKSLIRDHISEVDSEVWNLIKKEKARQKRGLELIASENFTSKAVCDALGSCLINKYSEGYPGARYYAGNEYIDQIELLCQKRALEVYGLDPEKWGVNVQPLSGSPANFAIYTALVGPHGRIMGLDLADGGHLSHGFFSPAKKVSATSLFFESFPYKVDIKTGLINYDALEENASLFRPELIVAGISCYARWLDYARFRKVADKVGAVLLADMSHISGLVAGGVAPSPFEYADVVMTTTHKSLRGPRGALIFYRKGVRKTTPKGEQVMYDLEEKINWAVFPGLQGGPHNHTIGGIAVALKQCQTIEYREYAEQILKNAQALAGQLIKLGYTLTTNGTDCHLVLVDLRPNNLEGLRIETVLDMALIACNKNTCPGDKSPFRPGGIRLGTPALTSRGFKEDDFVEVANFIHKAIEIYRKHESRVPGTTIKAWKDFAASDKEMRSELEGLGHEVEKFASQFEVAGNEDY